MVDCSSRVSARPAGCDAFPEACVIARPDGTTSVLVAEVQQHLGDDRVRAVAMDSTDGLARGTNAVDTGAGNLWSEKERAIYATESPPEPGVVTALRSALSDRDAEVRASAAIGLGALGDDAVEAASDIARALASPNQPSRPGAESAPRPLP